MKNTINAKTLRGQLGTIIGRAEKGERFTVLYRSRPVCQIVPADLGSFGGGNLEDDPIYQAGPLGYSSDGKSAADHDEILYGKSAK